MNYNEAVNFCLPDWLEQDLTCVKHYKQMHKSPVFSHDELLVTIFHHERSAHVSKWLLPQFEEMVTRELAERASARATIPNLREMLEDEERPDEYLQCQTDKSYCYLSQITSPSVSFVTCPEHCEALGANVQKVMKCRFSDEALRAMVDKIKKRAGVEQTGDKVSLYGGVVKAAPSAEDAHFPTAKARHVRPYRCISEAAARRERTWSHADDVVFRLACRTAYGSCDVRVGILSLIRVNMHISILHALYL